jgi:Na+-translocating ferredoxin:NAD+ oxidoreductase RnfD subunit
MKTVETAETVVAAEVTIIQKAGAFFQKYMGPIFISLILWVGHLSFGILEGYENLIITVVTCVFIDMVVGRLYTGTWKNLASAYISGISVSILVRSTVVWPYIVTAAISILSKYVIRYKGRHIWNPSNLGISWMLLVAPAFVAGLSVQWGNNLLPMVVIWMLGMVIVYRAKRLHITLTYIASFMAFAYIRSFITNDPFLAEVAPLTGPMYQLFIFFMITDPPTNVRSKKGQILVVFLVAVVEFILRLNQFIYAPFYALTIVGPLAKIIDLHLASREQSKATLENR